MFGSRREKAPPQRRNFLLSLPLWILLIVSLLTPSVAFAETTPAASTFSLEFKNKLINLSTENSSALEILRELETKMAEQNVVGWSGNKLADVFSNYDWDKGIWSYSGIWTKLTDWIPLSHDTSYRK